MKVSSSTKNPSAKNLDFLACSSIKSPSPILPISKPLYLTRCLSDSTDDLISSNSSSESSSTPKDNNIKESYIGYLRRWTNLVNLEEKPLLAELLVLQKTPVFELVNKSLGAKINSIKNIISEGKLYAQLSLASNLKLKEGVTIRVYKVDDETSLIQRKNLLAMGTVSKSGQFPLISINDPELSEEVKEKSAFIFLFPNLIMFKRFREVINEIELILKAGTSLKSSLIKFLLDFDPKIIKKTESLPLSPFFNKNLNDLQKKTVGNAINTDLIYAIQGPPGTGKSTVINEIVRQVCAKNKKVLVCSSNNKSTDHLALSLMSTRLRCLRVGNLEKIEGEVKKILLSELIAKEIQKLKLPKEEEEKNFEELNNEIALQLISDHQVIFSTINGSRSQNLEKFSSFDYVIIDECAQSPEIASWLPLLKGKKIIIAGDHKQLPCCVQEKEAALQGYGVSLLERIFDKLPDRMKVTLNTQYRFNKFINKWPSDKFYDGKLVPGESNELITLKSLLKPRATIHHIPVMKLVNMASYGYSEDRVATSFCNKFEAANILNEINILQRNNFSIKQADIGIITPYSAQVELLRKALDADEKKNVEVATVDSFQGREKEVIILSLVRSNRNCDVGFSSDLRRLNVAVTRAKRALILFCDKNTFGRGGNLKELFDQFEDKKPLTIREMDVLMSLVG